MRNEDEEVRKEQGMVHRADRTKSSPSGDEHENLRRFQSMFFHHACEDRGWL
jgi:hypothetical protein